jgi:hypothetical protein
MPQDRNPRGPPISGFPTTPPAVQAIGSLAMYHLSKEKRSLRAPYLN